MLTAKAILISIFLLNNQEGKIESNTILPTEVQSYDDCIRVAKFLNEIPHVGTRPNETVSFGCIDMEKISSPYVLFHAVRNTTGLYLNHVPMVSKEMCEKSAKNTESYYLDDEWNEYVYSCIDVSGYGEGV